MNNERFAIPELLFHPSDVGIHEMGVAEALVYTVESLSEGEWLLFNTKWAFAIIWRLSFVKFSYLNLLLLAKWT